MRIRPHKVQFSPEGHRYTLDGRRVKGVTEVLRTVGLSNEIPDRGDARLGLSKGRAIHAAVALWARGTLDVGAIHPLIRPYVDQFLRFAEATRLRPLLSERVIYVREVDVAGRFDLGARMDGAEWLFDLKSGSYDDATRYQTALYALGLVRRPMRAAIVLDGKSEIGRLVKHKDESDYVVARSAAVVAGAILAKRGERIWPES